MAAVRFMSLNRAGYLVIGILQLFLGYARYAYNLAAQFSLYSHGVEMLHLGMGIVFILLGILYWMKMDLTIRAGILEEHKVLKVPLNVITEIRQSWAGKIIFTLNNGQQIGTTSFYTKAALRKLREECNRTAEASASEVNSKS